MKDIRVDLKYVVFKAILACALPCTAWAIDPAHDLSCYTIVHPSSDYLEDGVSLAPILAVANLGNHAESNVWFKFYAVDFASGDTTFVDSATLGFIGPYPDSATVGIPSWTPEGRCAKVADGGPFVELELIGISCLTTDQICSNDTIRRNVTVLLAHDVGVTELFAYPPGDPGDHYDVGTAVSFTATVENFGINQEHDVPVKLEIWDKTADPDTLVWQNIQFISVLDWRGDTLDNPYTAEVTFPVFMVPSDNWFTATCKTEMVGDLCPDDDINPLIRIDTMAVGEKAPESKGYTLDVIRSIKKGVDIHFSLTKGGVVTIKVFDASGRSVCSLLDEYCRSGTHKLYWDGYDDKNLKCPSGAYQVRMEAGGFTRAKKVVIFN